MPLSTSEKPLDLYATLAASPIARDVVRVGGPDALAYLQGQLSQDVEDLDVGATTWSFVLQPTGKVDAWVRVTRTAGDTCVLDVDGGAGAALVSRLRRFLLRTKAEVELLEWRCVALRGPGAEALAMDAPDAVLRVPAGWPGVEGADLLGPEVAVPPDVPPADPEAYDAQRIAAGVPALGAELTERTIPAEAGQWLIDQSVDFTKGCYTGQELVARIQSRGGNVPRRLRGLVLDGPAPVPPGATVLRPAASTATDSVAAATGRTGASGTAGTAGSAGAAGSAGTAGTAGSAGAAHSTGGGDVVGEVTSSIYSPALGTAVALAYVGRAVEPPAQAIVTWPGGQRAAEVRTLPLRDDGGG